MYDLVVIGGGAAGFFGAINLAEIAPNAKIAIVEKSSKCLSKVKISGGGRCNVTHACFTAKELVKFYPRGSKELLGPFNQFMCGDMMGWLDERGVPTKIEEDNRVFPESDKSQSIIDCFQSLRQKHGVDLKTGFTVESLEQIDGAWEISGSETLTAKNVLMATGSSPKVWKMLDDMGLDMIVPVPSLFTFNIKHPLLEELPGVSVEYATVSVSGTKLKSFGPLLVTHWGLSGPSVLKMSAWAARELADKDYRFTARVNWISENTDRLYDEMHLFRQSKPAQKIKSDPYPNVPKRLWQKMVDLAGLSEKNYADMSKKELRKLVVLMTDCEMEVEGKSTFKDEFVTAGGVDLKEVDFASMEMKKLPNLYMAGEMLNIDAVTGGFNFQAAWTTSWVAAQSIAKKLVS